MYVLYAVGATSGVFSKTVGTPMPPLTLLDRKAGRPYCFSIEVQLSHKAKMAAKLVLES